VAVKKAAAPVEAIDEIEALEEDLTEEAAKPVKKARAKKAKAEAPVRVGKTTKEAAEELGITPVRLRRILRTDDFINDGGYTKYDLDDETIERVKAILTSDQEGRKTRAEKRTKRAKKVENAAEEVSGELGEIEDLDLESDDEEEDLEDELEDEDEDDEV
jgi:predicted transcriptional regulator